MSPFTCLTPRRVCLRAALLTWLVAWAVALTPPSPARADDGETARSSGTIVLGRVSNNPRKHYAALDALGRHLVAHADRIDRHDTVLASDNDEMIELLRSGEVHLVSETAFSSIVYEQAAGARIFLRQWKGGRPSYQTLFFAREGGDIESIEDLAGRLVAFEDAGSTSGYFVPRATIAAQGLTLKFASEPRTSTDVGYVFADSEVNVAAWVARGKVDAGVTSDVHWDDASRTPPGLKKDLRVFHRTPDIIRSVMVAGPGLDEAWLAEISDILTRMHDTEEGRAVLDAFYGTTRFDRLVGDAAVSLDHARSLFAGAGKAPPS